LTILGEYQKVEFLEKITDKVLKKLFRRI